MPIRLRSIDRQFARFCRTGDTEALGRVFDATARELLHVAGWLAGNRADAEDLLQRTFLTAIEDRGSFGRERRVLPWLTGILTNHARNLRRERARRAALPARQEPVADPIAEATEAEFAAWLRGAREQIGPPYAEVLALHLEQGLNAKEIAEQLGRPAGTVRTQLVRALELLRRRMPNGFAAALAPLCIDPGALATIKQTVLATAQQTFFPAATGAAAAAALATGGILMSKHVLSIVAAALLLLALGIFAAWPERGTATPGTDAGGAALTAAHAPTIAATGTAAGADPVARREPAAAIDADPGFGSLRVVVRWQHDGSPAAGVGVSVHHPDSRSMRRDGVTDADGACTLRHMSPARWIAMCTHADEQVSVEVAAGVQGTAELTSQRHAVVRGTVVDEAGTPVASARIWIGNGRGPDERQFEVARSDARGWFALPAYGWQLIGARKQGMVPALAFRMDAGQGDREITLRLGGAAASVRGTVRDSEGRPIAWARVELGPGMQCSGLTEAAPDLVQAFGPQVITGQDGTFAFDGVDPAPKFVAPILRGWADGFAPYFSVLKLQAGNLEVDIRLELGAIVHGVVRDATGAPVSDARIGVVRKERMSWSSQWHIQPCRLSDAAGNFMLGDLPAGSVLLQVSASTGEAMSELQLTAGQRTEWNPQLGAGRSIRGSVFRPDGSPAVQMPVCFWDRETGMRRLARTDSEGRFMLDNVGDAAVALEVGELQQDQLQMIEHIAPGTDNLEIRLQHSDLPTARIRGRLVDENAGPVAGRIGLVTQQYESRVRDVQTDGSGAFDFGPLRPGRRHIQINTRDRGGLPIPPVELAADQVVDLGNITIPRPGSATLTMLRADGSPVARSQVFIYSTRGKDSVGLGGAQIVDGKGRIDALPPGRWWIVGQTGVEPAEIEIRSEETTHIELRAK